MTSLRTTIAAGCAAAILGTGFFAVSAVVSPEPAAAVPRLVKIWCKRDYRRLCPRYKVGTSRMRACMRSKRNYLSPVCKKALIDTGYARRYR
jgi:hypothetical protein